MGSDDLNHDDPAAHIHASIVRDKARDLRADQRRMVEIFDRRGFDIDRIADALDLDLDTVTRLLAADGRLLCTECAFARHHACDHWYGASARLTRCECYCRPRLH
jgi:DNA-directed RNA polymerase specialized sigma24 family protein